MTTQELIDYYADLLILQYVGQPRAYATIQTIVGPMVMDQLPISVQNAYDIDDAVGVQLDVIGKYAGISRVGYNFQGPVSLDDSDYRTLIKLKIVQNNGGSSLYDIQSLLSIYFPGTLLVFDYRNMQIGYFFDASLGSSSLAEFFVKQGLLPKPMGVALAALIYSDNISSFFGFRTYEQVAVNNSPFNTYSSYQMDYPWLSYDNAIF